MNDLNYCDFRLAEVSLISVCCGEQKEYRAIKVTPNDVNHTGEEALIRFSSSLSRFSRVNQSREIWRIFRGNGEASSASRHLRLRERDASANR